MGACRLLSRLSVTLFVSGILLGTSSCGSVGTYFKHRYEDFGDMADLGFSFTTTPQIGLYWNSLELIVAGYSKIDGYFVGFGGGQIGVTRHYNHCYGFLYAVEKVGWGDGLDGEHPEEVIAERTAGILGILLPPYNSGPNYTPACVHFFPHIAYVGLVWNLRYMQIIDFVLGWTTLDICGDDGYEVGEWSFPWRKEETPEE
ncbi:MAG: hypothetical protein V2A76_04530 [Planctomycetota bacterium]